MKGLVGLTRQHCGNNYEIKIWILVLHCNIINRVLLYTTFFIPQLSHNADLVAPTNYLIFFFFEKYTLAPKLPPYFYICLQTLKSDIPPPKP